MTDAVGPQNCAKCGTELTAIASDHWYGDEDLYCVDCRGIEATETHD